MIVESSFTGLFKTILMIIGALVALRFFGKLAIAKRNMEEERNLLKKQRSFEAERNEKLKNFGKVKITKSGSVDDTQDIDFEEIKD